jgi:hypothetical protein
MGKQIDMTALCMRDQFYAHRLVTAAPHSNPARGTNKREHDSSLGDRVQPFSPKNGCVQMPPGSADQSVMAQTGAHSTDRSNEDHDAVEILHQGFTGSNKTQFTVRAL